MSLVPNCSVLDEYYSTPLIYVGDSVNIPSSNYNIKNIGMFCDAPNIEDNYVNIEVRKSGVLIGTERFYVDPDRQKYTFDNGNLCLDLWTMNCGTTHGVNFDVYYNLESVESTHYLDFYIQPYSWYTPQGAADWLLIKIGDITGIISNFFAGMFGWEYVNTEIFVENEKVIIRIYLRQLQSLQDSIENLSMNNLSIIRLAIQAWITGLAAALFIIVIAVGLIVGYKFVEKVSSVLKDDVTYTPTEIVNMIYGGDVKGNNVKGIVNEQIDNCKEDFLPGNAEGYALCVKRVLCGAADGIKDALLEEYDIDCASLQINEKIDVCTNQYNIDNDYDKYLECIGNVKDNVASETNNAAEQKEMEECLVSNPLGGCLLTKDTAMILGVMLIGGYVIYNIVSTKK